MAQGKAVDLKSVGIGGGRTIALGNKNLIYKEGPDNDNSEIKRDEQNIKRGTEAGQKKHQEEITKIGMEERAKKIALQQKRTKTEERNKAFDDDLKTTDEQFRKKGKEEEAKQNEGAVKQIEEAEQKRQLVLEKTKRAESLQKAELTAALQMARATSELERKKAQEGITKANAEAETKLQEQRKKHQLEADEKSRAEQGKKKEIEEGQKRQQEQAEKEQKKRAEEQEKRAEQDAKAREKQRKNQLEGIWCHCQAHQINFGQNNAWQNCPSGFLFTGFHRQHDHWLTSVSHYHCCRPCRENANNVLSIGACRNGEWQTSFDREGWSNCPDNTFIQGFYKSSCNYIYCIELASCCTIQGSRGRKNCGAKQAWGLSLDRAGWSISDNNQFIVGLFRSGGHWLYNIEFPNQCTFYAYEQQ